MQPPPVVFIEPIPSIRGHQLDLGAVGQIRRHIEHQPSVPDPCLERLHLGDRTVGSQARQASAGRSDTATRKLFKLTRTGQRGKSYTAPMTRSFPHSAGEILAILDECCNQYTFPMLDNGYVYLAATRMALFRSDTDWALTIEVFGFSPRSGCPDTHIHTFASSLCNRNPESNYVSREAYENYLRTNPHNESRFIYAMEEGPWIDDEDGELVSEAADAVQIRGARVPIPGPSAFAELGIDLEEPPRLAIFELCRALAASHREALLATNEELRVNVQADMAELLRLDQWHHPNVIDDDERPSGSPTFQQLAAVLVSGDVSLYKPTLDPNTHWRNWPDGGSL